MAKKQKGKPQGSPRNEGDTFAPPTDAAKSLPPQASVKQSGAAARAEREQMTPAGSTAEPAAVTALQSAGQEAPIRTLRPIQPTNQNRMRLGEAFRREGLDERALALAWVVVVEKLSAGESVEKLLVDVLKECDRILEPPRTGGAGGVDVPTVVNLYHNVPRPVRDVAGTGDDAEHS